MEIQLYFLGVHFFFWNIGLLNIAPLIALNSNFLSSQQMTIPPTYCLTYMAYTWFHQKPGEKRLVNQVH